jgi:oxygen-independent coproporphyrinogen-3 oxidase
VSKCPYCDFNSHALREPLRADEYITAVVADLESSLPLVWGRTVASVFIGGGTPSLFSARQIGTLLTEIRSLLLIAPGAEITLEANPGAMEYDSFAGYGEAGINRISLGVQSFDDQALSRIGRIHGRAEIDRAIDAIGAAGIENFNIDLMYALPAQSVAGALADVRAAVECGPAHISHYQLTLEPNTAFALNPPELPDEDSAWEMQERCSEFLWQRDFSQYEVSAWAITDRQCQHNLNYWRFGDYLGLGAGAHSKLTLAANDVIRRQVRQRHPKAYLNALRTGNWIVEEVDLDERRLVFEFFLNQLRLRCGVRKPEFNERTGLEWKTVMKPVETAMEKGLLEDLGERLKPTELGWRFVNDIQQLFLPAAGAELGEKGLANRHLPQ